MRMWAEWNGVKNKELILRNECESRSTNYITSKSAHYNRVGHPISILKTSETPVVCDYLSKTNVRRFLQCSAVNQVSIYDKNDWLERIIPKIHRWLAVNHEPPRIAVINNIKHILITHRTAANKYNQESLNSTSSSDHPRETDEEDDTEDVLDARQVDTDERAHAGRGRWLHVGVRCRCCGDRVRVVRQGAEEGGRSGPVLQLFLLTKKVLCSYNINVLWMYNGKYREENWSYLKVL